jgi:TPR repeat protein
LQDFSLKFHATKRQTFQLFEFDARLHAKTYRDRNVPKRYLQSRWTNALFAGLLLAGVQTAFAGPVEDGASAYEKGDYDTALKLWRPLAEQGDAEAQRSLGQMYDVGRGVAKDDAQATLWYLKAAEQGNAGAQYRLGMTYIYGRKSTPNIAVGLSWFEKAAYQGDIDAQRTLGELREFGDVGVPRDHAQAVAWFRKAAKQGDVRSMLRLISFSRSRDDYAEASTWSRKLAELGHSIGQYQLGIMYAEGLGVPKDRAQALAWLQKAASQHDFNASLARKYLEHLENPNPPPEPPPPDFDTVRRQAEQGNAEAQNRLGILYRDDRSVLKDDAQAVAWFRKAAEQNNAPAESNLADMYFEGKGVPRTRSCTRTGVGKPRNTVMPKARWR